MNITVVDIVNDTQTEMKFGDVMKKYWLSFENAKYYSETGQIFDGRYYLVGMGANGVAPDDYWSRR